MTWVEGRKLDTVTVNGQTYTYIYNSDGQRVKKINPDGSYIEYYVMDGTTVGESHFTATGNKTLGIRYTLDESGTVVGFTMNGVNYYFAKNLQGDVLAVYNATTNKLAAQYTYDSWGNILTATGTLAETNPFRYRGYYYDEETGLYYLQSRYYDPQLGRFISADALVSTGQGLLGNNMFAYCGNNPINYTDPTGTVCWPLIIPLIIPLFLSGCSGPDTGAAPEYVEIPEATDQRDPKLKESNPNCYSYAIGIYSRSYDPGDFSGYTYGTSVESVAVCVVQDGLAQGRVIRILDSVDSPISDNEYRIALRVSNYDSNRPIHWDYHFMVQTSSGQWAEKHGPGGATVLHASGTPNTISWDCGPYKGFYTSRIIYFAVSKENQG